MVKQWIYEKLEQRAKELEKKAVEGQRVEESLLREKNFSESIIDSMPGIFYFFDDTGKLLRWNKNFEKISGYSAEEISRMSPLDFFEEEDKSKVAERIQEVFTKGKSSVEADFVSKNGNKTPYYFTGAQIIIGNKNYLGGMGINITDSKQAEEALRESEERYRLLADNVTDVIWTRDLNLNLTTSAHQSWISKAIPLRRRWLERWKKIGHLIHSSLSVKSLRRNWRLRETSIGIYIDPGRLKLR